MTLMSSAGTHRSRPVRVPIVPPVDEAVPRPLVRLGAAAAAATGILLIAVSFRSAASAGASPAVQFLFWVGVFVGITPAAVALVRRRTARVDRLWVLLPLAAVTGAPRLLRAATPLFPDEFGWWRATLDVVHAAGGGGLVPGTDLLPGLPVAVGALSSVTGLSTWTAAMLLLLAAHLLGLVAVYRLAMSLLRNPSYAGVAALVWAFNPLSLYGGLRLTSVALAVPLALFVLALTVRAVGEPRRGRRIAGALVLTVLIALTDLMVALLLVLLLVAVAAVSWVCNRQRPVQLSVTGGVVSRRFVGEDERPRMWALVAAVGGAAAALVALFVLVTGGAFVPPAWFGPQSLLGSPSRASAVEAIVAVLAGVVLVALSVDRAWALWNNARRYSGRVLVLSLTGLVSFLGLPAGLLLPASAPLRGAWLLTYVGVALLVAPPLVRGMELGRQLADSAVQEAAVVPIAALSLAIVLLGSTAAGEGIGYRYPGPVEFGRDGRADLAEIASIARAFSGQHGRVGILADRYTGPAFTAWSGSRMPRAAALLPGNELMQGLDPTGPQLAALVQRGYGYLVVDLRMAGVDPEDGHSFGPNDPGEGRMSRETALLRLDRVPWVSRVAASPHYRVYRFDLAGAGRPLVGQADDWGTDYRTVGVPVAPDLPASTRYDAPASIDGNETVGSATPAAPPAAEVPGGGLSPAAALSITRGAAGAAAGAGAPGHATKPGKPSNAHPKAATKGPERGTSGSKPAPKPGKAAAGPAKPAPKPAGHAPKPPGHAPTAGHAPKPPGHAPKPPGHAANPPGHAPKPGKPAPKPGKAGPAKPPPKPAKAAPKPAKAAPRPANAAQHGPRGAGPSAHAAPTSGLRAAPGKPGRATPPGQAKKHASAPRGASDRPEATFGVRTPAHDRGKPPSKVPPGQTGSHQPGPPDHAASHQPGPPGHAASHRPGPPGHAASHQPGPPADRPRRGHA